MNCQNSTVWGRLLCCGLLLAASLVSRPAQADFYLSPGGNDDNSGTLEKPFRTLERARDAVRALKAKTPDKPITVLIRGGTYRLEQSVVFSGRDSGSAKAPITYRAFPGETAVFSGGRAVTGWKRYRDQIVVTQLPQIENQYYRFRELFFNGQRQIRARYPNRDPKDPRFGGWAFIESTLPADDSTPIRFTGEKGVFPRQWAKPDQGDVFIIPGLAWNSHLIPIQDYNPQTGEVTVARRMTQIWDRLMKGNRFYVENLLEELDQPGEWCFDAQTLTLYFWPPQGKLDGAEVTIPVIDRLIELRATTHEPVRHLHFSGLTFTQTLPVFPWIHPLNPDYLECNRPNSGGFAFYLENTEDCAIDRCRFDQVGGDAIRLHGASTRNRITRNEIVGSGAQGICFADLEFWPYHYPAVWRGNEVKLRSVSSRLPWAVGNIVENNHIHDCGVIDNFGAAIHFHALNTDGNVVAHNHIHDQPHHAIYFSMGFGQNIIEYNDLHDLCFVMADAGGVYCNRWGILPDDPVLGKGQIVRFNRIRGVMGVHPQASPSDDPGKTPSQDRIRRPHMTWGIYFDNSPRRAQVYGNLCIDNTWGGVFLGGGYAEPQDCVVENNVFVNSSVYQLDAVIGQHASGNRFRRNIISYAKPDAALMRAGRAWKDDAAAYRGWQEFDSNLYHQAQGAPLRIADLPGGTYEDWRKLGFDQRSLIADPRFVDPAKGDYCLKPESSAWKLGFKPIPFERIGPQRTGVPPRSHPQDAIVFHSGGGRGRDGKPHADTCVGMIRPDGAGECYPEFGNPAERMWSIGYVAPDGREIEINTPGSGKWWRCQLPSWTPREIPGPRAGSPSSDGKRRANFLNSSNVFSVYWTDSNGGNREDIMSTTGYAYCINTSPDGGKVAYHITSNPDRPGYEVYVLDLQTKKRVLIASDPKYLHFAPTWSPDGKWLLYQRCEHLRDPGHDRSDLILGRPDGSEHRVLTTGQRHWFAAALGTPDRHSSGSNMPAWSPDGRRIACALLLPGSQTAWPWAKDRPDTSHFNRDYRPEDARGGTQVCTIDLETGKITPVTHDAPTTWNCYVAWSPDGSQLAFVRANVGFLPELWVMHADGGNQRRLTRGRKGAGVSFGRHPNWVRLEALPGGDGAAR